MPADVRLRTSTGASRARNHRRSLPSAIAILEGHPIEIKRATSNTLNQVRAVKYIPIAALFVPADQWFVIPAHVIVVEASRKRRGQHTENPFESATLSLGRLGHYSVDPGELRERTLHAIEESARYSGLRDAMESILRGSRALADKSVADVTALIADLGLERTVVGRGSSDEVPEDVLKKLFGEERGT